VALARVALLRVPLWILDEPTSNLDSDGQAMFMRMLDNHLRADGLAIVATHHALQLSAGEVARLELAA
jgi:heme exporter protein A